MFCETPAIRRQRKIECFRRLSIAILRYCYGDERDGPQERQASFVPPLLPYEVIAKGIGKLYRLYIPKRLSLELVGQV